MYALLAALIAIVAGVYLLRPGSPAGTPMPPGEPSTYASSFLPLLHEALTQGEALAALGVSKDRNLLRIAQQQQAMQAALAAADAWLVANPTPDEAAAAVSAYRSGEDLLRSAMNEARAGFVGLDFARVTAATVTVQHGVAALQQAVALLSGAATPRPPMPP